MYDVETMIHTTRAARTHKHTHTHAHKRSYLTFSCRDTSPTNSCRNWLVNISINMNDTAMRFSQKIVPMPTFNLQLKAQIDMWA